jgi:hypothetical protein
MAVCVLPGTELGFAANVTSHPRWAFGWKTTINQTTAIFRQVNKDKPHTHHDALEFSDGQFVLLTHLGRRSGGNSAPASRSTSYGN